jgi:hypothetical protein
MTASIIVPTTLIAMTAIPITRQSTAFPLAKFESTGGGEGYHVGLAVFWLALAAMMLVCVSLPFETGVGGRGVGV